MSGMIRRLQVLVEEDRFAHLEALARQRETSIAALVRDALDRAYPQDRMPAHVAADRFLARRPLELGSWEEAKREIERGSERGLLS